MIHFTKWNSEEAWILGEGPQAHQPVRSRFGQPIVATSRHTRITGCLMGKRPRRQVYGGLSGSFVFPDFNVITSRTFFSHISCTNLLSYGNALVWYLSYVSSSTILIICHCPCISLLLSFGLCTRPNSRARSYQAKFHWVLFQREVSGSIQSVLFFFSIGIGDDVGMYSYPKHIIMMCFSAVYIVFVWSNSLDTSLLFVYISKLFGEMVIIYGGGSKIQI